MKPHNPQHQDFTPVAGRHRVRLRLTHARPRQSAAFTLVELIVALAVVTSLIAMGVPFFHDWIDAYRLANHAKHLAETMTRARSEAVRRGYRVNLCKTMDQQQCADQGNWDTGFLIYADINNDGKIAGDGSLLEIDGPSPPGITVHANQPLENYISYTSLGRARMRNGALQMGTLTVCKSGQRALEVVLANSGRVRIEKSLNDCP